MPRLNAIVSMLLCLISASATAFQLPDSFKAEYRLEKYNTTVAEMTLELSSQNNQFIYSSITHPYGLAAMFSNEEAVETSHLIEGDQSKEPRVSHYEFTRQEKTSKNQRIELDWNEPDKVRITGNYGQNSYQLQHQGLIWDRLSVQLALANDVRRTVDMAPGQIFNYAVIERGDISEYKFEFQSREKLHISNKEYSTVKLKRLHDSGKKSTLFWLSHELDYIPVKIAQYKKGKLHLEMELSQFTRQKP